MRNIKLTIRYDGTGYSGWQFQKNARTVQDTIEKAIRGIVRGRVSLIASGRTDAGVHAAAQIANFRTASKIPLDNLRMALNAKLPEDILIVKAEYARAGFNAQKSAKSKHYRYTIYNNDFMDPFLRCFASKCFFKLNASMMRKGARCLIGRHDFTSFRAKDGQEKESVRTIKYIKISRRGDLIYIDIEADGFLYNMVRNIAGTLIDVGRGKIPAEDVRKILSAKDRRFCGPTAPARGLSLIKVNYR